ncbi:MAG TPA: HoxN/HupN/NixA family nickel/cobalt transporter [Candidatus Cybelea sp.]|nr:HoxN/HupN/NixA family nickel/cobalt transporter [Candidatus Cybelea sp.]
MIGGVDKVLGSPGLGRRVVAIFAALLAANIAAWAAALIVFWSEPLLLGTALLAYGFGLRHAVDADHIAAIDNVTRKLLHDGRRPAGVGLYFSLGHSTVVIAATVLVAATATAVQTTFPAFKDIGAIAGTFMSAAFLLVIAAANTPVLLRLWRDARAARRTEADDQARLGGALAQRGLLARMFRPLLGLIGKSWHMYPLGFLFGLGFDTASEIGLLGVSAAEAAKGLPIWSVMVFPALFTAGMALVDTADGVLMLGAYGWAVVRPAGRRIYNMAVTGLSVLVAVLVGGVELLGLIGDRLGLDGRFWRMVGTLNDNSGAVGYVIVAVFALSWLGWTLAHRLKGSPAAEAAPRE